MKRKYSTMERAAWNKRYYQKKKRLGWTTFSFLTPVIVSKKLQQLKRELMKEFKKKSSKPAAK